MSDARPAIIIRMAAALRLLKRAPKAFYLGPEDWADFIATSPPTIRARRGDIWSDEPSFERIPVRASVNVAPRQSRLYDNCGYGRSLPAEIVA